MPVAETPTRSYSFRAPVAFGERMDRVREALGELDPSSPTVERILHEFEMAALRRPERLAVTRNQSELMRAVSELLVMAVEKVERDDLLGEAFAAEAQDRSQDESDFTRASTRAAARRWRD